MHDHTGEPVNRHSIEMEINMPDQETAQELQFWIFSYNRGAFLRNCVDSIKACAPACPIHIFDDNSDDAETCRVLEALKPLCRVHYPTAGASQSKHGGLYANMQSALATLSAADLVCFLQDDTQLVRPVTQAEVRAFGSFFGDPSAGFLMPAFMRGCNRQTDGPLTRVTEEGQYYLVDRVRSSAGAWYSDIFISRAGNLQQAGWTFGDREPLNEQQARRHFKQMHYLRNPFVAWLPLVPAFRGKKQTWALRRATRIRRCGFYPLQIMSDGELEDFMSRDIHQLPFAENFLKPDRCLPQPWIYYPLQGSRMLKTLDRVERKLAGWINQ